MNINRTNGFTIIEVLISMVILSIGILGLGVLQLTALRNTQTGYLHSQATILASDAIESMRANITSVTAADYVLPFAAATPAAVDCYGAAANCSTNQIAASDLNRWRTMLDNFLPGGTGQIATVDNGDTTQVSVTVQWIDPTTAEIGPEQLTLVTDLPR